MEDRTRVLIVEDLPSDAELAQRELARTLGACEFRRVETREGFTAALEEFRPDLVISDFRMPQFDGIQVLELAARLAPRTPVIVLTSAVNEDTAVACMKAGAADYLVKDHMKRVGRAAERALAERRVADARARAEEALRIKDYAVESAASGIGLADLDSRIFYVNDAFCRLYGFERKEDVLGRLVSDMPFNQAFAGRVLEALFEGREYLGEVSTMRLDGSPLQVEVSASIVRDGGGRPICMMASFLDVSARRRAEAEAAAWRQRYEIIASASRLVFYERCDAAGTIELSASVREAFGFQQDEIGGRLAKLAEYVHPGDRERVEGAFSRAARTLQPIDIDYRLRHADGRFVDVHDRAYPAGEPAGAVHYVGVMEDVSEARRQDQVRRLLSHTMESVTEIVTITDLEDRLTFVNDAFVRTYGYGREEILGRHVSCLNSPNNPPDLLAEVLKESHAGAWRGEILNLRKDGTEFPIALRTSQVRDEHGVVLGLAGISEDVSERKHLEAQLRQAQKLEAVGRLAGGIAHDYNNATGVVLGYAEMLKEELSDHDPLRELVDAIILAAQRSVNLTRQLLAFARKQVIRPVVVNLNDVLGNVKGMIGRLIGEDVHLSIQQAPDLWNVRMDPTQIEQVLANLATNARDAIADVGAITIRTANLAVREGRGVKPGEYVELTFSDTGKGMDAATREQVFEPFFTTKPSGQGTGLGLSTVFGIVEQNGGSIALDSEPGRGTTVTILLPKTGAVAAVAEPAAAAAQERGTETVLVVEDEEQLLDLARRTLTAQGYKVIAARSCGDAILLEERHAGPIAALVTDVVMPGMNGRELWERIAKRRPGIKVLFMSGYTEDVVVSRGVTEGRGGYLEKPFTGAQLTSAVRTVLDETAGSSPEA